VFCVCARACVRGMCPEGRVTTPVSLFRSAPWNITLQLPTAATFTFCLSCAIDILK
jgi:hypothetical protein